MFQKIILSVCAVCTLMLLSCSTEKIEFISTPTGVEYIENGRVLVQGAAACGFCHGASPSPDAPLSGGQSYHDIYGEYTVPNITPDSEALGQWSTDQLVAYFRHGHDRDEEEVSQVPHRGMEWMSDDDLMSIIAYLNTLAPVRNNVASARPLTFLDRNTNGFFQGRRDVTGFVPAIPKKSLIPYGQYLVENVARCGRCHDAPDSMLSSGDSLSGGMEISNEYGEMIAPDITSTNKEGVGSWNEEQIIQYLQSGKRPNAKPADPHFCPIGFYRNIPSQDLRSIARYLKSVVIE